MRTYFIFLFCLTVTIAYNNYAQDNTVTYYYERYNKPVELIIDISHLRAFVSFRPETKTVIARTEFTFRTKRINTDSISFYAPGFEFKSISIRDVDLTHKISGDYVIIYPNSNLALGEDYRITFEYEVSPQAGTIYFVGWDDKRNIMRKQIWAHRPHGWLPFIDDRFTVEMFITFDKGYSVFSNGERVSVKDTGNNLKSWHYRMNHNHPFFSTALVIGKYLYKSSSSQSGVPLELWYYPEMEKRFNTTYKYSEYMIDFFESELGFPYPYELYRQAPVANYLFGAMETTTSTIFGDYMLIDTGAYWQRNYINVNAHELAHQWFGNCISHLTPRDVWLTESFATFYAKLFERDVFGEDYYQNDKLTEIDKTFTQAKSNNNPLASSGAGTFRIYQKGSLVLDMLRYVLGDEYFRLSIKYYLEKHNHQYAETNDFLRAIYWATGMNLDWFFEQWIYRGGEPHYLVSYTIADDESGQRYTVFNVKQIHQVGNLVQYFRMPIDFLVFYKDGSSDSVRAWVDGETTIVKVPNKNRRNVQFTLFDPGNRILKKVSFDKDFNELTAQALNAPNMIDRYDALIALRKYDLNKKLNVLDKCYDKETFHLTKGEIISQIGNEFDSGNLKTINKFDFADETPLKIIRKAIYDQDALVRKAVVENIKKIHVKLKKDYITLLDDVSNINVELALENLTNSFPKDIGLFLDFTKNRDGWRGKNIRMKWLEIALLNGKDKYLDEIIDYASNSYEFETRMNAISTLQKLNIVSINYLNSLFEAVLHWNFKLSNVAKDAVKYYAMQPKLKSQMIGALQSSQFNESQKQMILDVINQ